MPEVIAVAVKNGAEPGAAWLAEFSIVSADCSSMSVAWSPAFNVFKLSRARASSMSDMARSPGLAEVVTGIAP